MRITSVLRAQHNGFMFKKHWHIQGKRRVQETSAAASLLAHGVNISDPKEYLENWKNRARKPRFQ